MCFNLGQYGRRVYTLFIIDYYIFYIIDCIFNHVSLIKHIYDYLSISLGSRFLFSKVYIMLLLIALVT